MTDLDAIALTGRPVVLYDGVCGFCNRVIRNLLRVDKAACLRFVPLESTLGCELLAAFPADPLEPEGVILIANALTPGATIYRRSEAVAEALRLIGGGWGILGALVRIVPIRLREAGYALLARYRYRIFGRFAACPIPTEDQRSRILGVQPSGL